MRLSKAYFLCWILLLAVGFPVLAVEPCPDCTAAPGWRIDRDLKFHVAFLEPGDRPAGMPVPALGFAPEGVADITNINLKSFLDLGFPVPSRPDAKAYNLYLKFFAFPPWLDSGLTAGRLAARFRLPGLRDWADLDAFLDGPGNLVVKAASIAPIPAADGSMPAFPGLQLPTRIVDGQAPRTPQGWFDAHLPFSSLYLLPAVDSCCHGSEAHRARHSACGVEAFHRELLQIYRKDLREVSDDSDGEAAWFTDAPCRHALATGDPAIFYRVPRVPMVFANYRDLPMPQDPKKVFLSGLLLVRRWQVEASRPVTVARDLRPGTAAWSDAFRVVDDHVLEVGSVTRVP